MVEWVAHLMMKSPKAVRASYLNCHGATYHAAQNIELVAGSDPYQEQADLFAERWGIDHSHIYNDHREMLEKEFLDIVSVCTVRQLKFGQILYKMLRVQESRPSGQRNLWP